MQGASAWWSPVTESYTTAGRRNEPSRRPASTASRPGRRICLRTVPRNRPAASRPPCLPLRGPYIDDGIGIPLGMPRGPFRGPGGSSNMALRLVKDRPADRADESAAGRPHAVTAAPMPGRGGARFAVTVAEAGGPQAGAEEGKVIRQLGHDLRTPLTSI